MSNIEAASSVSSDDIETDGVHELTSADHIRNVVNRMDILASRINILAGTVDKLSERITSSSDVVVQAPPRISLKEWLGLLMALLVPLLVVTATSFNLSGRLDALAKQTHDDVAKLTDTIHELDKTLAVQRAVSLIDSKGQPQPAPNH